MPEIVTHTFESAFADRMITGPQSSFREDSKLYTILGPALYSASNPDVTVQCVSPRVAQRIKHRTLNRVFPTTHKDFNHWYARISFSHITLGKTIVLPKIFTKAPTWSELRPWLEDTLEGRVSVFLGAKETRLSFSQDGDYALARLAWG
jgi:hypothetical protein